MATTKRSDLIVPEILLDAVRGEFAGMQALNGTGAAIISGTMPNSARGGDTVKIPYFGTIGEFEDLASDEGGVGAVPALTPAKITSDSDSAAVEHSGKAFEITEWAQLAANFSDPYSEAARQMRVGLQRKFDSKLITAAETTTLELDVTAEATTTLTYDHVVDAKMLWGDEQEDIALMVVHSKQYGDLLKLKDGDGRPLVVDPRDGGLPRFVGIPLKVSDRVTVTEDGGGVGIDTYTALLCKRNALALWYAMPDEVQVDKDILADTRVAALHVYYAKHLYRRPNGGTKLGVIKLVSA